MVVLEQAQCRAAEEDEVGIGVAHADAAGRPQATINALLNRTTQVYDAASRRAALIDANSKRYSVAYNAASQLTRELDPLLRGTTYGYDAAGRQKFKRDAGNARTTFSYDAADRRTSQRLGNMSRVSFTYDAADRTTRIANLNSTGTTLSSFRYMYDAASNRSRVVESSGDAVTWSYDVTYQLRRERRSGSNSYDVTHSYDPVGNRLVQGTSGTRTTFTYDVANQLTRSVAPSLVTTFSFDAAGNQTKIRPQTGSITTYTWDVENRMRSNRLATAVVTHTYNGDHLRVSYQDASFTYRHAWDGQNPILERRGSGTGNDLVWTYEPGMYGLLLGMTNSKPTTSFYLFDALGSSDRLLSAAQAVTDSDTYKAFGELAASTGSTTDYFRWIGQLGYFAPAGDSAHYYVRRRWYRNTPARRLSVDPMIQSIALPAQTASPYPYASNSPIVLRSASGLIAPIAIGVRAGNWTACLLAALYIAKSQVGDPMKHCVGACMANKCNLNTGGAVSLARKNPWVFEGLSRVLGGEFGNWSWRKGCPSCIVGC